MEAAGAPTCPKPRPQPVTDPVFLVIGVPAVISAGQSRQNPIIPKARGQHIGRRYRVSGGPQQAGIRYTGSRLAQPGAVPVREHELPRRDGNAH
jgi:hypothetical protein